jgi:hypothetical protein
MRKPRSVARGFSFQRRNAGIVGRQPEASIKRAA